MLNEKVVKAKRSLAVSLETAAEDVRAEIRDFNDSMQDKWSRVESSVEDFNKLVEEANEMREEVCSLLGSLAGVDASLLSMWGEELEEISVDPPDNCSEDFDEADFSDERYPIELKSLIVLEPVMDAFSILALARDVALKDGRSLSAVDKMILEMVSDDFDHLMKVLRRHFRVEMTGEVCKEA